MSRLLKSSFFTTALLTAILFTNTLFQRSRLTQEPDGVHLLDRVIDGETFLVAITVGWNWLLAATDDSPGPQLIAVLNTSTAVVLLLALSVLIALSWILVPILVRMLLRRAWAGVRWAWAKVRP